MEYEWDDDKNQRNLVKHGVAFEDAIEVFEDPNEVTIEAKRIGDEERSMTTGRVIDSVLSVVHATRWTPDGVPRCRIISARPASRGERKRYEQR